MPTGYERTTADADVLRAGMVPPSEIGVRQLAALLRVEDLLAEILDELRSPAAVAAPPTTPPKRKG
jgi:hypothetical protein